MKNSVSRLASSMTTQVEMLADLKEACQEAKNKGFLSKDEQDIVNAYISSVCNPWGIIHRALGEMDEAEKAEKTKKPAKAEKTKKPAKESVQVGLSFLD